MTKAVIQPAFHAGPKAPDPTDHLTWVPLNLLLLTLLQSPEQHRSMPFENILQPPKRDEPLVNPQLLAMTKPLQEEQPPHFKLDHMSSRANKASRWNATSMVAFTLLSHVLQVAFKNARTARTLECCLDLKRSFLRDPNLVG